MLRCLHFSADARGDQVYRPRTVSPTHLSLLTPHSSLLTAHSSLLALCARSFVRQMAALTDPTGTFVQTAKDCASSVTKVVKSKMTAKQRKKAKYLTRCFSVDPSKLKKTTEAVAQFGSSILG